MNIDDSIYKEIQILCERADKMVESDNYVGAIEEYGRALSLVPEPKSDWEASGWIYCALGDVNFMLGNYDEALNYLFEVLKCPDEIGNPFVLLRIGQCFYEKKAIREAREYFIQAYMVEGVDIFEDEDDKYIKCIEDLL
jgi:tetratricopeptide (TPR) repeat protein